MSCCFGIPKSKYKMDKTNDVIERNSSSRKKKKKQDSIKMEEEDLDEPHEKVWTVIVDATDPFRIL